MVSLGSPPAERSAVTISHIPNECKAGVVTNIGPNYKLKVQIVTVPESSMRPLPLQSSLASAHSL
jgi:hypothetical protein